MRFASSLTTAFVFVLLLAACRKDPTPTPPTASGALSASASSSASSASASSASAPPMNVDAGPHETLATWGTLRWEMDRAAVTNALRAAKYENVANQAPSKTPSMWISADVSPTQKVTVYFDEKGAMNQIVVITEKIPESDQAQTHMKLDGRFGLPKEDRRSIEKKWNLASEAHIVARVSQVERGWTFHEERGRGKATGAAGVFDLVWGGSLIDTELKLRTGGFTIKPMKPGLDSCSLPNAPPDCGSKSADSAAIEIFRVDGLVATRGTLAISKTDGLFQISFDKVGYTDRKAPLGELNALDATNGQGDASRTQHTVWRPGKGEIVLDTRQSGEAWSAIEAYRPTASTP